MYTSFQLAKKYFHYYFTARNRKGHGTHSPFVFDFIIKVLNNKIKSEKTEDIEKLRRLLLKDTHVIEVEDFGAGSSKINTRKRLVKAIASSSLKTKKFSSLLAKTALYYKSKTILELGTSFGITTSYLAAANPASKVYTLEGSKSIALIAQNNFNKLGLSNINLVKGDFDKTLPGVLKEINKIDFAFVDGNHRKEPTLDYFNQLLKFSGESTIIIFDDIHWSRQMEKAWETIKDHPAVTLTIDLFFMGLVFFKNEFKVKQHFVIRF